MKIECQVKANLVALFGGRELKASDGVGLAEIETLWPSPVMMRTVLLGFALLLFSAIAWAGPDSFSDPVEIGPGHAPDIMVDSERERIHLIYLDGDGVYYRKGSIGGSFGPAEVIVEKSDAESEYGRYWYPRIELDDEGDPHVVFSILKPEMFNGLVSYYSNRKGGHWKKPLGVFKVDEEGEKWVNFPHLAIEPDGETVYLACKNKKPPIFGELAKVVDASTKPEVVIKREVEIGGISLLLVDEKLQVFGGEQGEWHLFEFNKESMEPTGKVVDMAEGVKTEQIRAYQDAEGDVHFSGATWHGEDDTRGFYNSLSRVIEGEPLIRYKTTNGHHCGNGRVVRDALQKDRVYNFYFSGATGGKHGVYYSFDCEYNNQVHFARIERGELVREFQGITHDEAGHGSSYRLQVAAEPHPRGGAIVVFPKCGNDGQTLYLTLVGERSGE